MKLHSYLYHRTLKHIYQSFINHLQTKIRTNLRVFFLYETIIGQREKGRTFDQIAEWLDKKGHLSVHGKKFKGNHVHSILKKKRLKDEKLEREYPEVWCDFSFEVVDKSLVFI